MCGIAGVGRHEYGDDRGTIPANSSEIVDTMLDVMGHRGPDDRGVFHHSAATLGHTRLSIVGLDTGHQPITADDGRRAVIANGEIYNFETLRNALADTYEFSTASDSEVILHLYARFGADCVRYLDGMFAFCVVDGDNLLLARDPIGIKPLYYGYLPDGHALCFASELCAMTNAGVDDVHEFPAGHYYTPADGFVRYYNVPDYDDDVIQDDLAAITLVRDTVISALEKRLLADPSIVVSAFLSGGLDSSIVAALAAQRIPRIATFAVGVVGDDGRPSGDIEAARVVAEHIGSRHYEKLFTRSDFEHVLDKVIAKLETYDPALVRSAVPNYFCCQLAAEHATVVLTGEGADEVFAGYQSMKRLPLGELNADCRSQIEGVHNINLQRADRMGMLFSLELRVPFFDTAVIDVGMRLDPRLKIREVEGQKVEKWVLRKAFEDLLPAQILWRDKVQFTQGAGCESFGEDLAERTISDQRLRELQSQFPQAKLTSKEAALYFEIFRRHHPQDSVLASIDLWPGFAHEEERKPSRGSIETQGDGSPG